MTSSVFLWTFGTKQRNILLSLWQLWPWGFQTKWFASGFRKNNQIFDKSTFTYLDLWWIIIATQEYAALSRRILLLVTVPSGPSLQRNSQHGPQGEACRTLAQLSNFLQQWNLWFESASETYSSIKSWSWQSKEQTRIHLVMRPAVRLTCRISCKESRKPQQSRSQPRHKPIFSREFRTKLLKDPSFHGQKTRDKGKGSDKRIKRWFLLQFWDTLRQSSKWPPQAACPLRQDGVWNDRLHSDMFTLLPRFEASQQKVQ